jgi:ABC-type polysaccharide/polyol phosphate export permease
MNPLLQMMVLAFVFSQLMRFKVEHFPLFLLSGILVWNFVHQSIAVAVNSIVSNGGLLRKIKLSSAIFPMVSVGSAAVNFSFALFAYFAISTILGRNIGWYPLLLPLVFAPLAIFVLGISLMMASINVRYRDVGHMLDPILSIIFYATPIIYPIEVLPEKYRSLLFLNPMSHYVSAIRGALYDQTLPDGSAFALMFFMAFVALTIGVFVYRRMKNDFIFYV